MGRLQRRLDAGPHLESLSLQDGEGTIHGPADHRESEGWADRVHQNVDARLGWILSARRAGRSWLGVDLGSYSGAYRPVGADSGISEAHGPNDVSRGRKKFATVERFL